MFSKFKALSLASAAALFVGLLAGLVGAVATTPDMLRHGLRWDDAKFLLVFAAYNLALGLVPGLVAHTLLVRLKLTGLVPYLVAAALIGSGWCIAIPLSVVGWAYVLPCALVGTATFWTLRRPDRSDPSPASTGIQAA